MRFLSEDCNDGLAVLQQNHPAELAEIQAAISGMEYHVQLCGEAGRTSELIFSPSLNNDGLKSAFRAFNWECGVALENPTPETGRDVDYYKNGVVVEVQFAHYALCITDVSRMQRLFTQQVRLKPYPNGTPRDVLVGVEIVVDASMPTSQGVARLGQLRTRAAPLATSLPLWMVGVLPPQQGDIVVHHALIPRSRKSTGSSRLPWR